MNPILIKYQNTIDNLPLAARSTALAIVLSIIFVVWYYGFWQNLSHSMSATSEKIKTLKSSISLLKTQLKTLEERIKTELSVDNKNIAKSQIPDQTKTILYELLKTTNNLVLLQLKNTLPKEIMSSQTNIKAVEYGIVIKFQGDYFSTMRYLQAIEKLQWKIFWDKLEYKVTQYPMAEVTLYIHTINFYGS